MLVKIEYCTSYKIVHPKFTMDDGDGYLSKIEQAECLGMLIGRLMEYADDNNLNQQSLQNGAMVVVKEKLARIVSNLSVDDLFNALKK